MIDEEQEAIHRELVALFSEVDTISIYGK